MDFSDWSWLINPCLAGILPGTLIGASLECHQIGRLFWLIPREDIAEAVGGLLLGVLFGGIVGVVGAGETGRIRSIIKGVAVGGVTGWVIGYRGGDRGWVGFLEGLVVGSILGSAAAAVFHWVI